VKEGAQLYESLLNECEACLERARVGEPFSVSTLGSLTTRLVRTIDSEWEALLPLWMRSSPVFSIALHGVNVAILSARVGRELELKPVRLADLALAGLLNDIGMVTLMDLAESPSVLGASQLARLREHPWVGHRLLERCSDVPASVREIVLQEHERIDGSGYPQRLSGDSVGPDAQLIGLLDLYEALTHDRPHRRALIPAEAMRTVIQDHRAAFRDELLRGLLRSVPIFPPESWVQLSSGEIGKIVSLSASNPLGPVVRIETLPDGSPASRPEILDLSSDRARTIVRAVRQPLAMR